MTIKTSFRWVVALLLAGGGVCLAQNATTSPVGTVVLTIPAAGNATTPSYSIVNIPLSETPVVSGVISSVGDNTVTVNATVTQTFSPSNPHLLRVTSGSHAGRAFTIASNASNVLTIDPQGTPLTALSPAIALNSDQCQIVPADTLMNIFGTLTQGNATAAGADQVWMWSPTSGQYNKYYYNTTNARWQDAVFGLPSNNVVIRPDSGVMFMRRATTPLSLVIPGDVRTTSTLARVQDSGYTMVSGGFPVDTTLSALGLHNQSGWVKSATPALADQVMIWSQASAKYTTYYYHPGNARWQELVTGANSDATVISAGSAVFVRRAAVAGLTFGTYSLAVPFSL